MKVTHIPFQKTGFFSEIMHHYLEQNENLSPFYTNFSDLEGFKLQLSEKEKSFTSENRTILSNALLEQYVNFQISEETKSNIQLLKEENTFTILLIV